MATEGVKMPAREEFAQPEVKKEPVSISLRTVPTDKTAPKATTRTTVNLNNLLKVDTKKDQQNEKREVKAPDEPFTAEHLRTAWMEFAGQRKIYHAEYQLLAQEYELRDKQIVVPLLHPVQETMLNAMKTEITAYLREKLKNNSILVVGELKVSDDKKMMYTPSDKFKYLAEKNPILLELKERLGLDTDF